MIVHMIGNSHLQPAGMWSLNTGKDEALATLRSAVERCEEFPLFKYSFGEIWAYQLVHRMDPKLFKRIKKLIRKKQWSLSHGLYTLPNPATLSSETWKRLVTVGHSYCIQHFGVTPKYVVNFEATAFPESYLDQLLDAGYKGMIFHLDGEEMESMDSSIFRWENEQGKELLCYRISPTYRTRSHELYGQIVESVETGSLTFGHTICYYGIGNHGGGPSKENIEYILDNKDAFEGSELKFSTVEEFFSDALLMSDSFPVHKGPIGKIRLGQLSTRMQQRQSRSQTESVLVQAQRLSEDFATKAQVREMDPIFEAAWRDFLMSSTACFINGSYIESNSNILNGMLSRAALNAQECIYEITRSWSREHLEEMNYQQLAVFNTGNYDCDTWIEFEPNLDFDKWGDRCLCDVNGEAVPYQLIRTEAPNDQLTRILFRADLKARQCTQYLIREFSLLAGSPIPEEREPVESFRVLKTMFENSKLVMRLSQRAVTKIAVTDQKDVNLLGRLGMSFSLFEDKEDTIVRGSPNYQLPFLAGVESEGWLVEEQGPLRAVLINRGVIGDSSFTWRIRLYKDDGRIYHSFRVHFHELEKQLQLNIQLEDEVEIWTDATSAGSLKRESSDVKLPFHGWTKGIHENGSFGVISRNLFCFSHDKNRLDFTLLRSPKVASGVGTESTSTVSREIYTDQGIHEFEFVIIPQCENYDMAQELEKLMLPAIVMDRYEGMNRPPWGNSSPVRLQEMNEERAIKDGIMTHLGDS